ncbi:MAG: hypothetical protein ACJAT4_001691 [Granulosicoccus sp.]|jgi:hypothetical protein
MIISASRSLYAFTSSPILRKKTKQIDLKNYEIFIPEVNIIQHLKK